MLRCTSVKQQGHYTMHYVCVCVHLCHNLNVYKQHCENYALAPPPPPPFSPSLPPSHVVTVAIAAGGSSFGPGRGQVLFQIFQCNGSEQKLLNCPYSTISPFGFRCLTHNFDAGVVCEGDIYTTRERVCVCYTSCIVSTASLFNCS